MYRYSPNKILNSSLFKTVPRRRGLKTAHFLRDIHRRHVVKKYSLGGHWLGGLFYIIVNIL
jgi:hypothetical protein